MGRAKEKGGLGFCDLESFNMALLVKQGWRQIQYPDSYVAKNFREKYFPNGIFWRHHWGKNLSMLGVVFGMRKNVYK